MRAENEIKEVSPHLWRVQYAPGNATLYDCYWSCFDSDIFFAIENFGVCFRFPSYSIHPDYVKEKLKLRFDGDVRAISLLLNRIAYGGVSSFIEHIKVASQGEYPETWEMFEHMEKKRVGELE